MGERWTKTRNTAAAEEAMNTDSISQQLGPLESAIKIDYLRSEGVDGQDCYVLNVTPDMKALAEWVGQQARGSETDWQDLVNYADVFKEFSYTCYVAKANNDLKKLTVHMVMNYTAAQAGVSSSDFDKMVMEIGVDMKIYDQNTSFVITLPDEAASATEQSLDSLQNVQ
jgi:hypothetical protein